MLGTVALVVAFLVLNSSLSLLNRWALGLHGFAFPLSLTAMHMLVGSAALSPLMLHHPRYRGHHAAALRTRWRGVALIGVLNGAQIACNNAALAHVELALNQVTS